MTKAGFVFALFAFAAGVALAAGGADSIAPVVVAFVVALAAAGAELAAGSSAGWRVANAGVALLAILGLVAMALASRSR